MASVVYINPFVVDGFSNVYKCNKHGLSIINFKGSQVGISKL